MKKVIESEKGKKLFIYDGYLYRINKTTETGVIWRCLKRNCTSSAKSVLNYSENLNSFIIHGNHNHEIQNDEIEKKTKIFEMKN